MNKPLAMGDPAGGIASNAVDISKWLITQLDSGLTSNDNRIFDAAATKELWESSNSHSC